MLSIKKKEIALHCYISYILFIVSPTIAMGVLCPNNQPKSPVAVDIIRNIFSFLVRNKLFKEALAFSGDMVQIFQNSQLESSAFKVLASVTVIQLAQGDAVKVGFLLSSGSCIYYNLSYHMVYVVKVGTPCFIIHIIME